MTMTFVRALVTAEICTADGRQLTSAETTPVAGLAVVPAIDQPDSTPGQVGYTGSWSVLHLASAKTVSNPVFGLAQARELARLLGALPIDWTAPAQALQAAARADSNLVVGVHEAWLDAYAFGADSIEDGADDDR